jgi:hypothetical protein
MESFNAVVQQVRRRSDARAALVIALRDVDGRLLDRLKRSIVLGQKTLSLLERELRKRPPDEPAVLSAKHLQELQEAVDLDIDIIAEFSRDLELLYQRGAVGRNKQLELHHEGTTT